MGLPLPLLTLTVVMIDPSLLCSETRERKTEDWAKDSAVHDAEHLRPVDRVDARLPSADLTEMYCDY